MASFGGTYGGNASSFSHSFNPPPLSQRVGPDTIHHNSIPPPPQQLPPPPPQKKKSKNRRKRHVPPGPAGVWYQSQKLQASSHGDQPQPQGTDAKDEEEEETLHQRKSSHKKRRRHPRKNNEPEEEAAAPDVSSCPAWMAMQQSLQLCTPYLPLYLSARERYQLLRPHLPSDYLLFQDLNPTFLLSQLSQKSLVVLVHAVHTQHHSYSLVELHDECGARLQAWMDPQLVHEQQQQNTSNTRMLQMGCVWLLKNVSLLVGGGGERHLMLNRNNVQRVWTPQDLSTNENYIDWMQKRAQIQVSRHPPSSPEEEYDNNEEEEDDMEEPEEEEIRPLERQGGLQKGWEESSGEQRQVRVGRNDFGLPPMGRSMISEPPPPDRRAPPPPSDCATTSAALTARPPPCRTQDASMTASSVGNPYAAGTRRAVPLRPTLGAPPTRTGSTSSTVPPPPRGDNPESAQTIAADATSRNPYATAQRPVSSAAATIRAAVDTTRTTTRHPQPPMPSNQGERNATNITTTSTFTTRNASLTEPRNVPNQEVRTTAPVPDFSQFTAPLSQEAASVSPVRHSSAAPSRAPTSATRPKSAPAVAANTDKATASRSAHTSRPNNIATRQARDTPLSQFVATQSPPPARRNTGPKGDNPLAQFAATAAASKSPPPARRESSPNPSKNKKHKKKKSPKPPKRTPKTSPKLPSSMWTNAAMLDMFNEDDDEDTPVPTHKDDASRCPAPAPKPVEQKPSPEKTSEPAPSLLFQASAFAGMDTSDLFDEEDD